MGRILDPPHHLMCSHLGFPALPLVGRDKLLAQSVLIYLCSHLGFPALPLVGRDKLLAQSVLIYLCSHLGSNQGPSDYESDALTG
jgi:hypothetical protein